MYLIPLYVCVCTDLASSNKRITMNLLPRVFDILIKKLNEEQQCKIVKTKKCLKLIVGIRFQGEVIRHGMIIFTLFKVMRLVTALI